MFRIGWSLCKRLKMVNLISFSQVVKTWCKIFLLRQQLWKLRLSIVSWINSIIYGNSLNCLLFHFRSRWQFCHHLQRTRDLTDNRQDYSELTGWKTSAVSCLCNKSDRRRTMGLSLRNQNTRVKSSVATAVCKQCCHGDVIALKLTCRFPWFCCAK